MPTAASVTFMKGRDYPSSDSSIVLHQDSTIEMNLPDMWLDGFGRSSGKFDVGRGRWRLVQTGPQWELLVEFDPSTSFGPKTVDGRPWITSLKLTHQRAPYAIYVGIGDPDEDEGLEYVKVGGGA